MSRERFYLNVCSSIQRNSEDLYFCMIVESVILRIVSEEGDISLSKMLRKQQKSKAMVLFFIPIFQDFGFFGCQTFFDVENIFVLKQGHFCIFIVSMFTERNNRLFWTKK